MDQAPIDRFLGSFPMFFPIPPEQQDGCAWCGNNGIRAKPDPSVRVHQEFPENSGLELSPSHPRVPRAAERAPAPQAAPGGVNSLPKLVYYGTRCSKAPSRHPQGPTQTPLCASRGCFSQISPPPEEPLSLGMCSWTSLCISRTFSWCHKSLWEHSWDLLGSEEENPH